MVSCGLDCLNCAIRSTFNGWWKLRHLLSRGGSQFTLTSQWESRNVKTSPLASEAPNSLVRMSPSRFLVRTILTLAKRTMYSSSFSFKCSRKKGKKSVSCAKTGGANRRTGWHTTCKLIHFHLLFFQDLQNLPQILSETVQKVQMLCFITQRKTLTLWTFCCSCYWQPAICYIFMTKTTAGYSCILWFPQPKATQKFWHTVLQKVSVPSGLAIIN